MAGLLLFFSVWKYVKELLRGTRNNGQGTRDKGQGDKGQLTGDS